MKYIGLVKERSDYKQEILSVERGVCPTAEYYSCYF